MADGRAEGAPGDLPPIGSDGVPLADYVQAVLGPAVRMVVHEPTSQTDVSLLTPWWFLPPLFSARDVLRLHDALGEIDPDTDATRFARTLAHLWRGKSAVALPLAARMAAQQHPDLGDIQGKAISYPHRRAQMIELRRLARERDLRMAHLCDALRAAQVVATAFLAGDVQRQDTPIAAGWWGDANLMCAWRDGELRPREGAPAGTPSFRGVRLRLPESMVPVSALAVSYTSADVERWFRERVKAFASAPRHPTEPQDLQAAKQVFPGAQRDLIRKLRDAFVPTERRKQGPSRKG